MYWNNASPRFARIIAFILLIVVTTFPAVAARPAPKAAPYKITAIKAKLFYDSNGTFSRDVLAAPKFIFWNTVIGEGDAEAPSSATLVLVEIEGERDAALTAPRKINLTVTSGKSVVMNRTSEIGLFTTEGKYYAAFWVYDTGCQPLKLTAKITGQTPVSSKTATIPFACGE